MRLYCEPSVIISLLLRDARWKEVAAAIGSDDRPLTSSFGYGEAVSAIALRVRRERLAPQVATTLIDDLNDFLRDWERVAITDADILRATELVAGLSTSLRLADAIHVAITERLSDTLVTVDKQQFRAAIALGIPARNPFLSESQQ